ncbi:MULTISPECIES: restriction endonuclease [Bacillales]|jgi:restriction system protein|uniref:Endonuclease n=1 Tax=Brevibacillus aydinogluensis TaxID=927786 RepID=A0AA48MA94_9BACL|nr:MULTISPECIES: restriction endonuclease [Bacillales]REK66870.1 MAG: restriction endonuclease [Brevibacillus sp.]MDT3416399.1 restriction system protein [Brevibacillus aydinogluensis]NNV02354.1 restriction endonuclease [Brevibacillus sp. MCWH]UFJ62723.1 restriction endonuclease [Anoxybacillus sediminis]CAJ1004147.1 Endonuclease [Brevibacillus aydinogluensis]
MFYSILAIFVIVLMMIFIAGAKLFGSKKFSIPVQKDFDPLNIDIKDIDKMTDGHEFELYLYRLFVALGYTGVYKTVGSGDFGADLVFTDRSGVRNVIQAKRQDINNPVGIAAVQQVYSSMRYYKAKKSIVIASTSFTTSCETLAGINHVKLLDRQDLIAIINAFKQGDLEKAKDIIEAEPRIILESWSDYKNANLEVKKDIKAEKLIRNL